MSSFDFSSFFHKIKRLYQKATKTPDAGSNTVSFFLKLGFIVDTINSQRTLGVKKYASFFAVLIQSFNLFFKNFGKCFHFRFIMKFNFVDVIYDSSKCICPSANSIFKTSKMQILLQPDSVPFPSSI